MLRVVYENKYETWTEPKSSHWYETEEEVQIFINSLHRRTKHAQNIRVQQVIDVTSRFDIPTQINGQV